MNIFWTHDGDWDMWGVTIKDSMFYSTSAFNRRIGDCDVSAVMGSESVCACCLLGVSAVRSLAMLALATTLRMREALASMITLGQVMPCHWSWTLIFACALFLVLALHKRERAFHFSGVWVVRFALNSAEISRMPRLRLGSGHPTCAFRRHSTRCGKAM